MTVLLARAVRLAGGSRSAVAAGDQEALYRPPSWAEVRILTINAGGWVNLSASFDSQTTAVGIGGAIRTIGTACAVRIVDRVG